MAKNIKSPKKSSSASKGKIGQSSQSSLLDFMKKSSGNTAMTIEGALGMFGHSKFKSDVQKAALEAVCAGTKDVFISMPTGAGKSLCYQLPAVMSPGVTLVFSPLIALIHDQIAQLKDRDIATESLNSKTPTADRAAILADLASSAPVTKLLYVTPEMAATPFFQSVLAGMYKRGRLDRFAVDEAHCVSEWGHDFRPDYLKLRDLRGVYPRVPWVALTATATPTVQKDVIKTLGMGEDCRVFRSSSFRPNLFYDVRFKELLRDAHKDLKDFVADCFSSNQGEGCGIVYCRTRQGCTQLAGRLTSLGIVSRPYHAGLAAKQRTEVQEQWTAGEIPVIVATISFGMGVDKRNVRFVAHWTVPKSMESYYQESGRAGRDGRRAFCRLYFSREDQRDIAFLMRKEAQESTDGKRKGRAKRGSKETSKETSQKSFEALVKYCEEPACRHSVIVRFFGDPSPECRGSCDFCSDRKAAELLARQAKMSGSPSKTGMAPHFKKGQFCGELYGGGKWGYKRDHDGEGSDDEEETAKKPKDSSQVFQDQFFQKQFSKRRRDVGEPGASAADCRLLCPQNTASVTGLTEAVRSHCLQQLLASVTANAQACGQPLGGGGAVGVAARAEHDVLLSCKVSGTYKLAVNRKVKEIKEMTAKTALCSLLSGNPLNEDRPLCQFTKASSLLAPCPNTSTSGGRSQKDTPTAEGQDVTANVSTSVGGSGPLAPPTSINLQSEGVDSSAGTDKCCGFVRASKAFPGFVSASEVCSAETERRLKIPSSLLPKQSNGEDIPLSEEVHSDFECCSPSVPPLSSSTSPHRPSNASLPKPSLHLSRTPPSVAAAVVDLSPVKSTAGNKFCYSTAKALKSSSSAVVEKIIIIGTSNATAPKTTIGTTLNSEVEYVSLLSSSSSSLSSSSSSTTTTATTTTTTTAKQAVASSSLAPAVRWSVGDRKAVLAKVVVSSLSPHLRKGRIADKTQFKEMARLLANHLLPLASQHPGREAAAPVLKSKVEELVRSFFKQRPAAASSPNQFKLFLHSCKL